jgi:hypothetical protein
MLDRYSIVKGGEVGRDLKGLADRLEKSLRKETEQVEGCFALRNPYRYVLVVDERRVSDRPRRMADRPAQADRRKGRAPGTVAGMVKYLSLDRIVHDRVVCGAMSPCDIPPRKVRDMADKKGGPHRLLVSRVAVLPEYADSGIFGLLIRTFGDDISEFAASGVITECVAMLPRSDDEVKFCEALGMRLATCDKKGEPVYLLAD